MSDWIVETPFTRAIHQQGVVKVQYYLRTIIDYIVNEYNYITFSVIDDIENNSCTVTVYNDGRIISHLLKHEDLINLQLEELKALIYSKFKITDNYLDKITSQLVVHNTGGNMKYSDMLAAQLKAALEKEQAIEEKYGVDQTDGSVITFKAKFSQYDASTYRYAALRVNGLWYLTGRMTDGITWDSLCTWFESKYKVSKIKVINKGKSA